MRRSALAPLRELSTPAGHLFCMHHAGGAPTTFKDWPQALRRDLAVTATVLPGRGTRFGEPLHESLDAAADEMANAIESVWSCGAPIFLFGHSLGGLLAFEVGRLLEQLGKPPKRIIISGVSPIRREQHRYNWSDEQLIALMEEMGGTPEEVFEHEGLMNLCIPILRGDLLLVDTYQSSNRPRIRTPITAIGGASDRYVSAAGLDAWRDFTEGEFESVMFPGGHFYIEDHQLDVTKWLEEHLVTTGGLARR